jgi:hypothetical protein
MRARKPWQWEEFKVTASRTHPDRLRVTLDKWGHFNFNEKTFERLNRPEAMVLLYDRSTQTIGLRPASIDLPHAVLVRRYRTRRSLRLISRTFLSKHRIVLDRTVQFPMAAIDDEGVLILSLREMVATAPRNRRR